MFPGFAFLSLWVVELPLLSGGVVPFSCPGVVGVVRSVVTLVIRGRVQVLVGNVWL